VRLLEGLDRLLAGCERVFLLLANVCLAAMLAANGANILLRAVLDRNLTWVWPWTVVLMIWMTFLGFFVIYRQAKDIAVDYFVNLGGRWARQTTRILADVIVVVLMGLLLWEAPRVLASQVGELELVGLQRWVLSIPLFASAFLIALHYGADVGRAARGQAERPTHPGGRDA
jgi:TRAP-type C4-dicarboxylate transport system permease small subunit